MIFSQDRSTLRQFFLQTWTKRTQGQPLEPLEKIVAQVIEHHPEYHAYLQSQDSVERDFSPEEGNPFLHMSMHIAIHEQLSTAMPTGIIEAYQALLSRYQDPHQAEHHMIECLGEALWQAQQNNQAPDEAAYLQCLTRSENK